MSSSKGSSGTGSSSSGGGKHSPDMKSGTKIIPPTNQPLGTPETSPVGPDGVIPPVPPKSPPGVPAGPLDPRGQEEIDKQKAKAILPKTHGHNS